MKQDPFANVYRASTPEELAEMFMNPNAPKTEAEHWAVREIEKQRAEIEGLRAENNRLREALTDMLNGWRYIRETYGDLAGVGWDRAEQKARSALEGKP